MKLFIRYVSTCILEQLLKVFWLFPVKKNKILFISFDGKQYSDSPRYVFEYLKKQNTHNHYVWAFNHPEEYKQRLNKNCEAISYKGWQFIKNITDAKVIVVNDSLPSYIPIRKNQIVLNTWHGGGVGKKVGFSVNNPDPYNQYFFRLQNKKYTAYLSSSKAITDYMIREGFHYNGTVLEYGLPRNSVLFGSQAKIVERIYSYFKIDQDKKIILYAPTFRGDFRNSQFLSKDMQLDIEMIVRNLKARFGSDYIFLFRAHHTMKKGLSGDNYIDATDYPDMQHLLCAADILITDYSSCMYDMALMYKPVFLFAPDYMKYEQNPGFYMNIHEWPFPLATSNTDLQEKIYSFNPDSYKKEVKCFFSKVKPYDSMNSTKLTAEWIIKQMR